MFNWQLMETGTDMGYTLIRQNKLNVSVAFGRSLCNVNWPQHGLEQKCTMYRMKCTEIAPNMY